VCTAFFRALLDQLTHIFLATNYTCHYKEDTERRFCFGSIIIIIIIIIIVIVAIVTGESLSETQNLFFRDKLSRGGSRLWSASSPAGLPTATFCVQMVIKSEPDVNFQIYTCFYI
jgi:hypothetical protein